MTGPERRGTEGTKQEEIQGAKGTHDEKGRGACLCEQRWDGSLCAPTTIASLCRAPSAKNSLLCSLDLPDD